MKALRNGMLTIAALALVGIFASPANAQSKATGSFTLPFEAKWGNAVLPEGDYTFTVQSATPWGDSNYLVTFAAKGIRGETILARKDLGPDVSSRNMLVAVRSGGKYRIRTLHLAFANLIVDFPAPKEERTLIASAPELMQTVPILVAAK